MVASDEVGEERAEGREESVTMLGTSGGVVELAGGVGGVGIGLGSEVGLPFRSEFPEVVPEAGEVGPSAGGILLGAVAEHLAGELGG